MHQAFGTQEVGPIRLVLRQWKVLLVVTAVSLCMLIFCIASLTPRFSAETMLILPSDPRIDLTERSTTPSAPQTDLYLVKSYIDTVKSSDLIRQVIRNLHLGDEKEFQVHASLLGSIKGSVSKMLKGMDAGPRYDSSQVEEERLLRLYRKRLTVANDEHSLTLNLSFQAEDPLLAAKIVNTHAAAYIAGQVAYRETQASAKTAWLDAQLAIAAKNVRDAQVAVQKHQSTIGRTIDAAADHVAELKFLQSVAAAKENVYQTLLNRSMVVMAEQHYGGSDTRVVSRASVPTVALFPNLPLFVTVAALVSVLLGAISAVSTELLRPSTPEEVARALKLRLLGVLRLPGSLELVGTAAARRARRLSFWEQVRALRSLRMCTDGTCSVLAVTSPTAGSGTSLVAASLARAMASSGFRTLLIDMDVKRPNAHNLLGVRQNELSGLGEALDGSVEHAAAVVDGDFEESLFLLTNAARRLPNVDAIAGPGMASLIGKLRHDYQAIVIDTPPVEAGSDAWGAIAVADSLLLVAPSRGRRLTQLTDIVSLVQRQAAKVHIEGIVFTTRGGSVPHQSLAQRRRLIEDKLAKLEPVARRRWPKVRTAASSDHGTFAAGSLDLLKHS